MSTMLSFLTTLPEKLAAIFAPMLVVNAIYYLVRLRQYSLEYSEEDKAALHRDYLPDDPPDTRSDLNDEHPSPHHRFD